MKDKHGVEIQVNDIIEFRSGDTATVLLTNTLFAMVKFNKTGHEVNFGFLDSNHVEIIKKANPEDYYQSTLDTINSLFIRLSGGYYEPRSQRDYELSKDLQQLLEKHNRSN